MNYLKQRVAEFYSQALLYFLARNKIENETIQAQISRLNPITLRCFWKLFTREESDSAVFLERPHMIDEELYRLSIDALGSEQVASFAVKELVPFLSAGQIKEASQIVLENFEKYKKEKKNDNVS